MLFLLFLFLFLISNGGSQIIFILMININRMLTLLVIISPGSQNYFIHHVFMPCRLIRCTNVAPAVTPLETCFIVAIV